MTKLVPAQQAAIKEVVKKEYLGSAVREDGTVVLSPERITAMNLTGRYFVELYGDNPDLTLTRDHFAMRIIHYLSYKIALIWHASSSGLLGWHLRNVLVQMQRIQTTGHMNLCWIITLHLKVSHGLL